MVSAYAKFDQIPSIRSKAINCDEILALTKDYKSVVNFRKLTGNNPNLDLFKISAYGKFDQIPSIHSQDIEQKRNFDNNQGPKLCYKFAKIDM